MCVCVCLGTGEVKCTICYSRETNYIVLPDAVRAILKGFCIPHFAAFIDRRNACLFSECKRRNKQCCATKFECFASKLCNIFACFTSQTSVLCQSESRSCRRKVLHIRERGRAATPLEEARSWNNDVINEWPEYIFLYRVQVIR